MARLAKIRAEREAAAAKRKAEADGMVLSFVTNNALLTLLHCSQSGGSKEERGCRERQACVKKGFPRRTVLYRTLDGHGGIRLIVQCVTISFPNIRRLQNRNYDKRIELRMIDR